MRKSTVLSSVMSLLVLGFIMVMPSFAQDTTLTYGDTVTGEITNENYEVLYSFEGSADDVILVEMTFLEAGLDPYLQLKNANGDVIFFDDDGGVGLNSVLGPIILPETGTYTIVATRYMQVDGQSEGPFELTLSQASLSNLVLNEPVTATLDADQNRVSFQYINEGRSILKLVGSVTIAEDIIPQINIEVRDSEGNWITAGYVDQQNNIIIDPIYLTDIGNYFITIVLEPNFDMMGEPQPLEDAINVEFVLNAVDTQTINLGDTVSGAVALGEADYYTFNSDQGTIIRLEGNQPNGETPFEVVLFNSDGIQFSGGGTPFDGSSDGFTIDPIRLDMGNEFLMVVRQINHMEVPAEDVSNYNITLSRTATPVLESGVEVTGTVGGDTYEQVYRYDGLAGQVIRLTLESADQNYAPSMNIEGERPQNPEETDFWGYIGNVGSAVPGLVTYEVTLPQDGVYFIRVNNGRTGPEGPTMGNFRLLIEVVE